MMTFRSDITLGKNSLTANPPSAIFIHAHDQSNQNRTQQTPRAHRHPGKVGSSGQRDDSTANGFGVCGWRWGGVGR